MISKIGQVFISTPNRLTDVTSISSYLGNLYNSIIGAFQDVGTAVDALIDLQTIPQAPVILKTYVKTALPDVASNVNGMIIVSNDVGGLTPAFSDGVNWRRTADRNIIS